MHNHRRSSDGSKTGQVTPTQKGGVFVVTPSEPPDPEPPSTWGTAVPSPSPAPDEADTSGEK